MFKAATDGFGSCGAVADLECCVDCGFGSALLVWCVDYAAVAAEGYDVYDCCDACDFGLCDD